MSEIFWIEKIKNSAYIRIRGRRNNPSPPPTTRRTFNK